MKNSRVGIVIAGILAAGAVQAASIRPDCIQQKPVGPGADGITSDGVVCPTKPPAASHLGQYGHGVNPVPTTSTAPAGIASMPSMGNSIATIAKQMPIVVLYNAQHVSGIGAQFVGMGPYMLALFSNDFVANGGNVPALIEAVAQWPQTTVAQMLALRAAFGSTIDVYVKAVAPQPANTLYTASIAGVPTPVALPQSREYLRQKGAIGWLGNLIANTFTMTQNELWWSFFTAGTGTTIVQATVRMAAFEGVVLYKTFIYSYEAGGYVVTYLDSVDPEINITIGEIEGITVDWTISAIETVGGTGYLDGERDSNGNMTFPSVFDLPTQSMNWDDCPDYSVCL